MIALFSPIFGYLNIWKKNSKLIYIISFIFLWIIMAFTYGNADENVYLSRYNNPEIWESETELLYMLLIKLSLFLGLSFQSFKVIITFIQLCLVSSTILKFGKCRNIVFLLYFIFPFVVDVAQMRNALATSVMIFSLQFLLKESLEKKKIGYLSKDEIIFIICIIIASFIHTASIIWLLLLIAKKCKIKTIVAFTSIFCVTFSFFITPKLVIGLADKFGATSRIGAYVSVAYSATRELYFKSAMIRVLFTAASVIILYAYLIHKKKNIANKEQLVFGFKCNIIILCILPIIINYTTEVYRMQVGLSILNYIIFTNFLDTKYDGSTIVSLKNIRLLSYLIVISIINLYFLVLGNDNLYTVFLPVFQNNALIDLIK